MTFLLNTIQLTSIIYLGVLSVTEYSKLIDEMCKDLKTYAYGLGLKYGDILISSLLMMDDIILMVENPDELQLMLNVLYNNARKYKINLVQRKQE